MKHKEKVRAEIQIEIFDLIEKEPDISTMEISRRLKIAPNTARKYRKEITETVNKKYEAMTGGINGMFSGFLKMIGMKN